MRVQSIPDAIARPGPLAAVDSSAAGRVDALLASSPLGPNTSIAVRDAATGSLLLARDEHRIIPPASNAKLATARAALEVLGPDHRFRTTIEASTRPDPAGTVHSDLALVGRGDPALHAADLAEMADQLHAAGVRRIAGGIVGDDSWLDDSRWVDAWPARMRLHDARALGALLVPDAADGTRVAAAAMPAPDEHAASVLREQLVARGIAVDEAGAGRAGDATPHSVTLASHDSRPVAEIVRFMLEKSNATTAELLTRSIGRAASGIGTTAAGAAVIRRAWPSGASEVRVSDGSGLAAVDRASTDSISRLLVDAENTGPETPNAPRLAPLMAVAGRSGTIRQRMTGADTAGRVQAKTGTLSDTSVLSGYVDRTDGQRLAFSIAMHPFDQPRLADARALQDSLVGALAIGDLPRAPTT